MDETVVGRNGQGASQIQLLLLDVDGVLTDGRVYVDAEGRETIAFSIQDGVGLKLWQRTGRRVGLLSGRDTPAVRARARQLKIDVVVLGRNDKLDAFEQILAENHLRPEQAAFMGDDLLDLPVLERCGYPLAPANVAEPVRPFARYVTARPGGSGAVSEAIQHLLAAAGEWEACLASYRLGHAGRHR